VSALIFDCDGVLADTERDGHRVAFNRTFVEFGVPLEWSPEDYGPLLHIGGGKERLRSVCTPQLLARLGLSDDPAAIESTVASWHRRKTEIYTQLVASGALPARPGIRRIASAAAEAGWVLAVASTSAEPSVRAVLEHAVGPGLATRFAVFAGDLVPAKKPAPDIYLLAVEQIRGGLGTTVVVEDSRNGLRAASAARLRSIVTISSYTAQEDFAGASLVVSSLGDPGDPTQVLADPFGLRPGAEIDLATLEAVLGAPRPQPSIGKDTE
jgi:HAD superfamily hydrolase (TIGR01509 family)